MPSILLKGKEEIILPQNVPFIRISSVVDPQFLSNFLMEYLERIKTSSNWRTQIIQVTINTCTCACNIQL